MALLSIIIPVAADPDGLRRTLASLGPCGGAGLETLVANDGAHPAISEVCRGFGVREISLPENRGAYAARNVALLQAKGAWLGFLDAGVVADRGWAARAQSGLERADYVAGPVEHPPANPASALEVYQAMFAFPVERYLRQGGFGLTANLAVRAEVFEHIGPFDHRLTSGGDLEFGDRVRRAGKFVQVYDAERKVSHEYRSLAALERKVRRTTMGMRQLTSLFPHRFRAGQLSRRQAMVLALPPRLGRLLFEPSLRLEDAPDGRELGLGAVSFLVRCRVWLIKWRLARVRLGTYRLPLVRSDSFEWREGGLVRP